MNAWCKEHHNKSGLVQRVRDSTISLREAEQKVRLGTICITCGLHVCCFAVHPQHPMPPSEGSMLLPAPYAVRANMASSRQACASSPSPGAAVNHSMVLLCLLHMLRDIPAQDVSSTHTLLFIQPGVAWSTRCVLSCHRCWPLCRTTQNMGRRS